MKAKDLSEATREWVDELRNGSSTIQYDISDKLEGARNEQEFLNSAIDGMIALLHEVHGHMRNIRDFQRLNALLGKGGDEE